MSSKMVTDRQKTANELLGVLDSHAEEANTAFAALLGTELRDGEVVPDLVFLQELLRRRLDKLDLELVAADEANLKEKKEDFEQRLKRDSAASEVSSLLSRLRAGFDATCGSGTCARILGIEGTVPRDPVVLARLAARVLAHLRAGGVEKADSLGGFRWDPQEWIDLLEGPTKELQSSTRHLARERQDSVSSLLRKTEAMEAYDRTYLSLARVMENLFRYTGLDGLAERVRPSKRTSEAEAEVPEEAPEELAEEASKAMLSAPEPQPAAPELQPFKATLPPFLS